MEKKFFSAKTMENSIWACWLIACLTRNNWIICAVCAVGFIANVLFAKNTKKPLKYIISSIFFFVVVVANLYFIFFSCSFLA